MKTTRNLRIAVATGLALLVAAPLAALAAAAGGRPEGPDPIFGVRGRVVVPLPDATAPSAFALIAAASGGRVLVTYVTAADRLSSPTLIERREADGALDPRFGNAGSVKVGSYVTALAEDPAGGVVYAHDGMIERLEPDGGRDRGFDARSPHFPVNFHPVTIAFDAAGRILVGGFFIGGARYQPREHEILTLRLHSDGRRDASFGTGGEVDLGSGDESGELSLLPDGSIVAIGQSVMHLAADGTVLSPPGPTLYGSGRSIAALPDGTFAVASSSGDEPGCTVTRYEVGGSPVESFAETWTYVDSALEECRITAAPKGGLLLRGLLEPDREGGIAQLLLLDPTGKADPGFGEGGSVEIPGPTGRAGGVSDGIVGVLFTPSGLTVAGSRGGSASLVGLTPAGAFDSGFADAGSVVEPAGLPSWTQPRAIAAMPDGELIATGLTDSGADSPQPFWMRFAPDGRLRRTPSGKAFASAAAVGSQLEPVGRRLYTLFGGPSIAALRPSGAPIEGFGTHGVAALPSDFGVASFVVDPDHGVTVFGSMDDGRRIAIYRVTASGLPDKRFGDSGLVELRVPGATYVRAQGGAVVPGGGLLVFAAADRRLVIARLGRDGGLRHRPDRDGFPTCRCGGTRPMKVDTVRQRGSVYALIHSYSNRGEVTDLLKLHFDGRLDRSFARRGYRSVDVGYSIDLFAAGERLLAIGQKGLYKGPSQVRAFTLGGAAVRLPWRGASVSTGGLQSSAHLSAALQPDGRLVIAGERRPTREVDGAKLELLGLSPTRAISER